MIRDGEHLFILADEVHRLGSYQNKKILNLNSGARLGLSATPRRSGDPEGTQLIFDFFSGVLKPIFSLNDAIKEKILTPYFYYVHTVKLSEFEEKEWQQKTKQMRMLYARNIKKQDPSIAKKIDILKIGRAKIGKTAKDKIRISTEIIRKYYKNGHRWIVYCDNQNQIQEIINELSEDKLPLLEYHYNMKGDRKQTLIRFEEIGGIAVSIRCLDEGVDIPSVTHALILASSQNPREFIQRRGRVLRTAKNKSFAFIHDLLVVPTDCNEDDIEISSLLESELIRGIEFGENARNPSCVTDLKRIAKKCGLSYEDLVDAGVEDDE